MAWDDNCMAMVAEMGLLKTVDCLRRTYGMKAVFDAAMPTVTPEPPGTFAAYYDESPTTGPSGNQTPTERSPIGDASGRPDGTTCPQCGTHWDETFDLTEHLARWCKGAPSGREVQP